MKEIPRVVGGAEDVSIPMIPWCSVFLDCRGMNPYESLLNPFVIEIENPMMHASDKWCIVMALYMNQCVSNVPYVAAKKLIDVMLLRMSMNPKCEYQPE